MHKYATISALCGMIIFLIDCRLDDTATVDLEIRDLNDNTPMFSQTEYNGGRVSIVQGTEAVILLIAEISSTALTGTSILAVRATDGDATPDFRAVSYNLVVLDS